MRRGFTLIELMVVVSIVAILSASAIPFLYRSTMRTRSAEASVILASIRSAQVAYHGRNDAFVECDAAPDDTPLTTKRPWADPSGKYTYIGFVPEGQFYFSYWTRINATGNAFASGARADLDGDGSSQHWGYLYSAPDGTVPPFPWGEPIVLDRQVFLLSNHETF